MKVIIIRYGEIHLKGRNRSFFEDLLVSNIKHVLRPFGATIEHISGRYIIDNYNETDEEILLDKLTKVAGIVSISPSFVIDSTYENIKKIAIELTKNLRGTFKVETNRADKTFKMNSIEINREIGGDILDSNKNLTVDVKQPDITINIDIRENAKTYIFSKVMPGIGGMPVGSAGKGLLLLSGGIDSPVAGFMMAKRGVCVEAIHFHSYPYTSPQAKEKVLTLAKEIGDYCGKIKVHVVSVTKIQEEIHAKCSPEFMITLLRRFMFRIAERVAKLNDCKMLITGESLGQVASQTIESITVVENSISEIPVLRPLIAFDKNETISIARKIGTYETSIEPFEDCCTVFLPDNPVTKPKLEKVLKEEAKLDVSKLINEALNSVEEIVV